jgi:uridylate kinase
MRRVLLKLSGEILRGRQEAGLDPDMLGRVAGELRDATAKGLQLALVVGGGNFFRGVSGEALGIDRISGDQIGMLSTVANGLAIRALLERNGVSAEVLSAIPIPGVVELFEARRALNTLSAGRVLIFVAGTGNPYFTTDTAAALRAVQIGADALLKGTKVDGIYSEDPVSHPEAERFDRLSFDELIERQLQVMDLSAAAICAKAGMPMVVFNMQRAGTLARVLSGEKVGTYVGPLQLSKE